MKESAGATRDSVLVRRAIDRQPGGATRIHGRYRRFVMAILSRLVRDPQLSEDLAQEAFLRAFLHLGRLRDRSRLAAWLASIARRVLLIHRRAPWARGSEVPAADRWLDDAGRSPEGDPEELMLARSARGAVESLPSPFRETLLARFFDELPVAEVARRQGIDVPLAKYRIRQGLQLLRRQLLASGEQPAST
ncbi:MAG: RNA polymerase sigma factor [Candidatus Riflebacteria bacterium]|nr:RNA polymerase sigma factor [Candidatus Riflebacteria bacterium]